MELVTTKLCLASDIGIHGNMFGGKMLSLIDEAAAAYVSQYCETPSMVTIKMDEVIFKKPVKKGNQLKLYADITTIGRTSIVVYIEVRRYNVYTAEEIVSCSTKCTFVRIDEEGNPIPISERIKEKLKKTTIL